jgi:hypothetical protein
MTDGHDQSDAGSQSRLGFGLWAVLGIVSGLMSGYFIIGDFVTAWASTTWPSVRGTVLEARVVKTGMGHFFADVAYSYRVQGTERKGGVVRTSGHTYDSQGAAQEEIDGLVVGQPVVVYYNPQDPSQAVLRPGASFRQYVLLVLPFTVFGWGAYNFLKLCQTHGRKSPPKKLSEEDRDF